ncbi:uncharacterized protein BDCG_17862 [Blastomyces dermatitidis ER-3]|uniref:Uncharacterized protein n=1 Tax=Ajellomyces dermatitidis (strain ER-3 / ATCC MYA-2586) TaxID=559297 RepID=A0ABX2W0Q7_AJEDR|nr:uncharacterized protein BDCG_17862 [Blastomyces dermatitidis ER-3]OAT02968.1 hypothetical protein BDCG_17862 [Blastomyces dermatitidis ER-3]
MLLRRRTNITTVIMKKIFRTAKRHDICRIQRSSQKPSELLNLGIRWDFDGEVTINGVVYNKFQVQPNARKVPAPVSEWRRKNGGTHAVMGSMFVKKDGSVDDVESAWDGFTEDFSKRE